MTTVAFIEEGAFLSSQRQHVSQSWESGSTALKSLDTRLEAAIEGMLLSPKDSQPACNHLLQENESGAVFMSCVLYIMSRNIVALESLIKKNLALHEESVRKELVSAFAWLPFEQVQLFFTAQIFGTVNTQELLVSILQEHRQAGEIDWQRILNGKSPSSRDTCLKMTIYSHVQCTLCK